MKLTALTILVAGFLTGCNAQDDGAGATVALGDLGPALDAPSSSGWQPFFLGAGDALGEQTFAYYVASLERSDTRYASEPTERPDF